MNSVIVILHLLHAANTMNSSDSLPLKAVASDEKYVEESSDHDEAALIKPNEETDGNNYQRKYYCGLGPFHPKWLQGFATKKLFTVLLFLFAFLQGSIVSGEETLVI